MQNFTFEEARELLPDVLATIDELIVVRSDLVVASHAAPRAALADLKAMEAQLAHLVDRLSGLGLQVKGWAPVLVDFPMRHDGRQILLCLLEGERELLWYHDAEHGFAGRRRLSELDL